MNRINYPSSLETFRTNFNYGKYDSSNLDKTPPPRAYSVPKSFGNDSLSSPRSTRARGDCYATECLIDKYSRDNVKRPQNFTSGSQSPSTRHFIPAVSVKGGESFDESDSALQRWRQKRAETCRPFHLNGESRDATSLLRTQARMKSKTPAVPENHKFHDPENDESGKVVSSEPGRWVGSGLHVDPAILTEDRGYLIWTHPRGTLEVIFRYGENENGQEFSCHIDPQYTGVMVWYINRHGDKELVVNGKENPLRSRHKAHRTSAFRNRPENNFEFQSSEGECVFMLEAMKGSQQLKTPAFKLNYVLTL